MRGLDLVTLHRLGAVSPDKMPGLTFLWSFSFEVKYKQLNLERISFIAPHITPTSHLNKLDVSFTEFTMLHFTHNRVEGSLLGRPS